MLIIILLRIAVTLTFLILAAGGPYAIVKLSKFIRRYTDAHTKLEDKAASQGAQIKSLEDRVKSLEQWRDQQESAK